MTIYSTKVSAHYIARRAAAQAGGTPVDFLSGTLIVGDGNGSVPAISALVAAGHVLHEVWRGDVIVAVTVDEDNAAQVDIRCVIPATVGSVEVGPFWVREFTISDENGVICVFGTTQVEKTTSAEGAISDLTIVAAIGESDNSVVLLSAPGSNFVSEADVRAAINAHQPTAEEPLYKADTTSTSGWLSRIFKVRRATQSPAQIGVERPATDAEFAAGEAGAAPASQWPWPTLQQVNGALDALSTSISTSITTLINTHHPTAEEPLYVADTTAGGWLSRMFKVRRATQSPAQIGVERPATDAEFAAGAAGGTSPWPWPTLQQVNGALDALSTSISTSITTLINTHHPTAEEPLYVADTTAGGWLSRMFKVRRATQAPAQIGVERPATDAEFAAGAPGGTSPWPWPTLQQVANLRDALAPLAGEDEFFFTPASDTEYQRDLTFTPTAPGLVIALSWWNISGGNLPSGSWPDSENVGMRNAVRINGSTKQSDNTLAPSLEFGWAMVPAGAAVTVTSYFKTQTTGGVFPPITQHVAYVFIPSPAAS